MTAVIICTEPLDRPGSTVDAARGAFSTLADLGVGAVIAGPAERPQTLRAGRRAIRDLIAQGPDGILAADPPEIAVGPGATPTAQAAIRRLIGSDGVRAVAIAGAVDHPLAGTARDAAPSAIRLDTASPDDVVAAVANATSTPPRYEAAPRILADFHLHTDHSSDCATTVPQLVERAVELGLGALCVTDHNTIAGGVAARAYVEAHAIPLHIAVASEIKTATGEVIGIYLEEDIPRGLPFADTVEAIHAQGGFVYVPHPCDRLHAIPPADLLERLAPWLDAFEVVNGRLARERFNDDAEEIANRLALPQAAGSDEHVVEGLFTAGLDLPAFHDPVSLALALQDALVVRRPSRYLLLQARKWVRTRRRTIPAE